MKWYIIILITIILNTVSSEYKLSQDYNYAVHYTSHLGSFLAYSLLPAVIPALVAGGAIIPKANRHKFPRYFSLPYLGFSVFVLYVTIVMN